MLHLNPGTVFHWHAIHLFCFKRYSICCRWIYPLSIYPSKQQEIKTNQFVYEKPKQFINKCFSCSSI
jgi:hypothetical protein